MQIMVTFELTAQSEKQEELVLFFKKILPDTKQYTGCRDVNLSTSPDKSNEFMLVEHWESQELFDVYLNWRKSVGDFDTLGTMLSQAPQITVYNTLSLNA